MSIDKTTTTVRANLPSLTGIRFYLACIVFLHHAVTIYGIGGLSEDLLTTSLSVLTMFFLLSGFVMAWTHRESDTPKLFYWRRIARIIPIYLIAVLAGIAFASRAGDLPTWRAIPQVFLLQCWFPQENIYFANNVVLWSLSCEAFFYLIFPLLIKWILAMSTRAVAALAVSFSLATLILPLVLAPTSQDNSIAVWLVYTFPPTRALEFVVGVCIGVLVTRGHRSPIPLLWAGSLLVATLIGFNWLPPALAWSAAMVIPMALWVWSAATSDLAGRRTFVSHPRSEYFGELSYSFYVFHWLILQVVATAVRQLGLPIPTVVAIAVAFVLSAGTAMVMYRFVERPAQTAILRRVRARTTRPTPA